MANGHISSIFDSYLGSVFLFPVDNLSRYQSI